METVATVSSRIMSRPRSTTVNSLAEAPFFARLCDAVESSDWDERLLRTKWIDRVCIGAILISVLFLVPVMVPLLFK